MIEDLGALSHDICKVLSIKNYLTEFVFEIVRGYWINARNVIGDTQPLGPFAFFN